MTAWRHDGGADRMIRVSPSNLTARRARAGPGSLAAACLAALLPACGNAGGSGSLVLAVDADETVFSPLSDMTPKFLVFQPLVVRDAVTGEPRPRLARRWEHSADYRHWTVFLRSDVRWHDGVPFTARDVEFTLGLFRRWLPGPEIVVNDDTTYSLTFEKQGFGWPLDDWMVYYPRHLLEHLDPDDFWSWDFWKTPVGNGPYRYVRHVMGSSVALEANADYFLGAPSVQRVVLRFGRQPLMELRSGGVHAATVQPLDLPRLPEGRFDTFVQVSPDLIQAILWNQRHPLLRQAAVRRALTLGIDRTELHAVVGLPPAIPVFDVLPTPRQYWRGELPAALPYDTTQAVRLLESVGWKRTSASGMLEKDGQAFTLRLLATPATERHAVVLQAQLRRIGVAVEITTIEQATQIARIRAGDFDAAIATTISNVAYVLSNRVLLGRDSPLGYHDDEVLALIERLPTALDPSEEDAIYRRLGEIMQRDLPMTVLHPVVNYTVADRRLVGLSEPHRTFADWYLDELAFHRNR
jgi:peptide/nickel transport system substrate-binding protein